MRKMLVLMLSILLLISVSAPVTATEQDRESAFVFTAVTANNIVVPPEYISYESGQSIREALLASGHTFVGLEQGFIYEIDGYVANYHMFYDHGGHNLDAQASGITALCIGVNTQYSDQMLDLVKVMAAYRSDGNVQNYRPASQAFQTALQVLRNGDAEAAAQVLETLNNAVADYYAELNGTKYTVTVSAKQGDIVLSDPVITFTDPYGNETTATGTGISVIAGEHRFSVSDGGYNRTEGTVTVSADTALSVELPAGEWFGDVKILDANKEAYPYTQDKQNHRAVFQIPDVAKELSSLYLNVGQGAVPDRDTTRLRSIYKGTDFEDYAEVARSWESTATALTYLVKPGMEGITFPLEAQYTDSNGHTQIQHYDMVIERTPTLKSLTVTAEGTVLPVEFDPVTYSYEITTVSDTLDISAETFGTDYRVEGTGNIPVSAEHTVKVSAGDKTTTYRMTVSRKTSVPVTLTVPEGISVQVLNAAGSVIAPVEGVYHLIPGASYTYRATKAEYYHAEQSFTASSGLNVTVTEPKAEDWLQDLALYNGNSVTNRISYACDSDFSPADHNYVFTVSDFNSTAYIQATSSCTVTAKYVKQTKAAATNGYPMNVNVDKHVSNTGSAQILQQVVGSSGYSNTVTLRVSKNSGGITYYQDYTLTLARKLHLSDLTVKDGADALALFDSDGVQREFDRDVQNYQVTVNRERDTVTLTGTFTNTSGETDCCGGYYALINGIRYDTLDAAEVPLDTARDSETIPVQVCHICEDAEPTTYTVTVNKTDPVAITFRTHPENAVVYLVNDLNGRRVLGENGVYKLIPGGSYSYTVTCAGYVGTNGSYAAPEESAEFTVTLEQAPAASLKQLSSYWPHLRQNNNNNGVISAPTPTKDEEAMLYWATKIGDGYDKNACGCPILVDGYLYTYAGSVIYKVDTMTGEIVDTGEMDHASSYAINPPTYADGMLFIGLADGSVQAFNAETLESLWIYRDPLQGQPNCSIIYHDGYVYTGFWVGEDRDANYVCLSATDEDPAQPKEEKLATWRYTSKGGFYWGGAYVCDEFLLIGTDDGESGYTSGKASLLSLHPKTGALLDEEKMEVVGDIRCSITKDNGKYYFTNKGGYFFEATVNAEGKIGEVKELKLNNYANEPNSPPMSTCTPTIYNGRAYVGVSGTNQFGAYSGHNITVIDIDNWEIAYQVKTQGYPQTSGVLTTAYEDDSVYVYFFDNYTPGKLRMLKDKPGQTSASLITKEVYSDSGKTTTYDAAYALFTPYGYQEQYAICSPIMDAYGTIYFKNDSAYLMAVGSAIKELEITQNPDRMEYKAGEKFDGTGMTVTAHYINGVTKDVTELVSWSRDPLTEEDTDFQIEFPFVMYQNKDGNAGVDCGKPFAVLQLAVEDDSANAVKYGDVNNDGNVDMNDVSLVLQRINGTVTEFTTQQTAASDVNADANIDMNDVSLILQRINGSITHFPPENQENTPAEMQNEDMLPEQGSGS